VPTYIPTAHYTARSLTPLQLPTEARSETARSDVFTIYDYTTIAHPLLYSTTIHRRGPRRRCPMADAPTVTRRSDVLLTVLLLSYYTTWRLTPSPSTTPARSEGGRSDGYTPLGPACRASALSAVLERPPAPHAPAKHGASEHVAPAAAAGAVSAEIEHALVVS
jgi:hypothetical protein